ncbi:MAG: ChbG/HpnK family deacetylase [Omnitrophica bacterium]|nr:ChbG/HpnK family deacetylase [Candidatus Omnitrophota bacterium]
MAKRLVINADDFGETEHINRSIIKCYTQGAVTDVSFLVVGESFEHALGLAKENGIKRAGIHLALTGDFKPVSPAQSVSTLIGADAKFSRNHRTFLAKYFFGTINTGEIYTEFKNQISKIKTRGIEVSHLDSHEHIHMVPGILKITIKLMKEEGIRHIRFPQEKVNLFSKLTDPAASARNILLSFMCTLSKKTLNTSGTKRNDNFLGHARALRLKKKELIRAIAGLKEGLTELSCHPGKRAEETDTLCDAGFIKELKAHSIELVPH